MKDYLLAGLGIAGIALCEALEKAGKTFLVFDPGKGTAATRVAGGIYNPVVLKRFKLAWLAEKQLPEARDFYQQLELKLGARIHQPAEVVRRLGTVEEQNNWIEASDRPGPGQYLDAHLLRNSNQGLHAPHGFGRVMGAGRVITGLLIDTYREYLRSKGCLVEAQLDTEGARFEAQGVHYGNWSAKAMVSCTGFAISRDPYFSYLPVQGNKGEYIRVRIRGLEEEKVVKAGVFLIPEGKDEYTVGATYGRDFEDAEPTDAARDYLLKKLKDLTPLRIEVVDQVAGIRPTVPDRRPILGAHPEVPGLYLMNGFGSRGLMIAPWAARQLLDHMEGQSELPPEVDVRRFTKKYFKSGRPYPGQSGQTN